MQPTDVIPAGKNPPSGRVTERQRGIGGRSTGGEPRGEKVAPPAQRANRRRLRVFLGVLAVAGTASLIYNYSRPAEYRASARVQINPGAVQIESMKALGGSQGTDAQRPLMTELQILTSRPVVEAAAERLSVAMPNRVSALGADPVTAMQASLQATSAGDTDVVELVATGADPELAAALVNSVIGTYKERLEQSYRDTSGEALERINDEMAKIDARVA
jgi:polysaccharide biosynthesis transport protein